MSNKYGIPNKDEEEIRARDKICVYCRKTMKAYPNTKGTPGDKATIEHLNFAPPFYWTDGLKKSDLVICCGSCNASRGKKELLNWFKKQYCLDRNINKDTVAEPVIILKPTPISAKAIYRKFKMDIRKNLHRNLAARIYCARTS